VGYSPNGKYCWGGCALGNGTSKVTIWETDTGKQVGEVAGPWSLIFSPDNRHVFASVAPPWNELRLIEWASGKVIRTFKGHSSSISAFACSRDGKYVAAGTNTPATSIRIWEVDSGMEVRILKGHDTFISSLDFSPDGKRLLSAGSSEKIVCLWDVDSGKLLDTFPHSGFVYQAVFSPRGGRALSCTQDGKVCVWQLPR
jgi:WD40 repeat protein